MKKIKGIFNLRKHLGLSQEGLAAMLDLSQSQISKWENGKGMTLKNFDMLRKFCKRNGVDFEFPIPEPIMDI